jgi:hypothetical protein
MWFLPSRVNFYHCLWGDLLWRKNVAFQSKVTLILLYKNIVTTSKLMPMHNS